MARDLGDLLTRVDALHGRSPALASAALLALGFSAHGGAKPSSAAADAAALLGFDRHALQGHVRDYELELEKLAPLLPFAAGASGAQLVPHVPLLLRLHDVVARVQAHGEAVQQREGRGGGSSLY